MERRRIVVTPHTNLFTQVDRTKDPDFFVRFMDEAQRPAGIRASKRLMLERAPLAPEAAVLEVGCGPGTDLFDIAGIVGPSGRLVGVDASEVMIAEPADAPPSSASQSHSGAETCKRSRSATERSTCAARSGCSSTSPTRPERSRRWRA
jgi:hypothetical protein